MRWPHEARDFNGLRARFRGRNRTSDVMGRPNKGSSRHRPTGQSHWLSETCCAYRGPTRNRIRWPAGRPAAQAASQNQLIIRTVWNKKAEGGGRERERERGVPRPARRLGTKGRSLARARYWLKGARPPTYNSPTNSPKPSARTRAAHAHGVLARLAPAPHPAPGPRRHARLPYPRPPRGRSRDPWRALPGAGGGGLGRPLHAAVRGAGAQADRPHQPQPYGGLRHRPRRPRRRRRIPPQSRPTSCWGPFSLFNIFFGFTKGREKVVWWSS